ncbi:MAG: phosphomannomutase/phosphoglucomutase [Nanoarchaeota archaeon]
MALFKAYDVRGIYPKELNEESAYNIGRAFADYTKAKEILIGRDMRLSSDTLFLALSKGITKQGANVVDIGIVSTPMCYFSSGYLRAMASIMITASHNPKDYNGFKFMRANAIPIGEMTGLKDIEMIYTSNKFKRITKNGNIRKRDIANEYAKHVLSFIEVKKIKPLNIVIDTANGMGSKEVSLVYSKLPCNVTKLYFELDGRFPNHPADPLKEENTIALQKNVLKQKADLGIAFDGDADRVFFIDENGENIPSYIITCLIAKEFLKLMLNQKIIYDIRSSRIVDETVRRLGGIAIMCRVGHTFMKEQLRMQDAVFGGELSGHFYFRENYYADSGIITSLKVMEILSKENKPFSELIRPLKIYYQSGEINSTVADKDTKIRLLAKKYSNGKISYLDGIRVDFGHWWFNVRPSNTEPLLRLNLEAKTKGLMKNKMEEVLKIIRE